MRERKSKNGKQSWMELLPIDRYKVSAKGLLHNYDRKVLTMLYQPLIGSRAFSLYMTLWGELEQDRVFGKENTHHSLMVTMQMQLPEIYEERVKLEAIGLLKVYIKKEKIFECSYMSCNHLYLRSSF